MELRLSYRGELLCKIDLVVLPLHAPNSAMLGAYNSELPAELRRFLESWVASFSLSNVAVCVAFQVSHRSQSRGSVVCCAPHFDGL